MRRRWNQGVLNIYDDAFSTRTGLERVGVVGLDRSYWQVELEDAGSPGLARVQVARSVPG